MNNDNNILIQNPDGIIGVGNISIDSVEGLRKELQNSTSRLDVFKDDFDFQLKMVNDTANRHNKDINDLDNRLVFLITDLNNTFQQLKKDLNREIKFLHIAIAILTPVVGFLTFGIIYLLNNL